MAQEREEKGEEMGRSRVGAVGGEGKDLVALKLRGRGDAPSCA